MTEPDWPAVLLVDDEEDTRTILAHVLRRHGYDPVTCSMASAVALARTMRPTIVVLDVGLARAYDIASELRREDPAVFVVALTGHGEERRRPAGESGIDTYVRKPADVAQLVGVLDDARHKR
jgi:DNA-binding response OmpR family regulator